MNWDALGASAELLGAAAVFFSFVYLAKQIRTSTRQSQVAVMQSLIVETNRMNEYGVVDAAYAEVLHRYFAGDELSDVEALRVRMHTLGQVNSIVSATHAFEQGQLEEGFYGALSNNVASNAKHEGWRNDVEEILVGFPTERDKPVWRPIYDDSLVADTNVWIRESPSA